MGISESELRKSLSPDVAELSAKALAELDSGTPRRRPRAPVEACSHYSLPAPVPTEHEEQVALFQWAEMAQAEWPELAMLFAVPNGGYRPMTTAAQLKAEGVRAGVPDVFLMCRRRYYGALAIELKRADRSNHATDAQKEWLERLREYGYMAIVAYGAQEAIEAITSYLNDRRDY